MKHDPFISRKDELALLGACLIGGFEVASDVVSALRPGILACEDVSRALDIVADILQHGGTPDTASIITAMRRLPEIRHVTSHLLAEAMEACGAPGMVMAHLEAVKDTRKRRNLRNAAIALQSSAADLQTSPDEALARLETTLDEDSMPAISISSGKEVAARLINRIEARAKTKGQLGGITTGFRKLDKMTDGIQKGDMWIVGARPSIGKTAFGCAVTLAACVKGHIPALFVTAEMSDEAIGRRMLSAISEVTMQSIRDGTLNDGEMRKIFMAMGKLSKAPIHWLNVDGSTTVAGVCASIRRHARKHGARLIVVDYLQRLKAGDKHEKRTYEVAEVSARLKETASHLGLSMLCLAQVNRESERNQQAKGGGDNNKTSCPKMSQLSDSGQIERDADCVCLLHRDRTQAKGSASLHVAKQRDGECGFVDLVFNGPFCRFEEPKEDYD